ncbi:MAG TPA: porin family protein [Gemmatimonadaceae bacterium]|nr:porin family protein [Gemmatimonadaceae bacterium]
MRPRDLFLSAALVAIAWTPSLSQSNAQSTLRFGVIGGANLATLTRSGSESPSNRTGFAVGLMAVFPVSPSLAIQPELMFTMKGAHWNSNSATAKVDYFELPVLARFAVPGFGRVKPFVYGGPAFAYRASCSYDAISYVPGGLEMRESRLTCDSLAAIGQRASPGVHYSHTDVDGIVGGGLAFGVGGRTMTVGVRYDVGFVRFLSDADSKNRVLSFMGTLEWPFRK